MIYTAPITHEEPQKAKVGCKFAQNVFIMKSAFKTFGITILEEELDESPMGLGIYYKDKDGIVTEKWKRLMNDPNQNQS